MTFPKTRTPGKGPGVQLKALPCSISPVPQVLSCVNSGPASRQSWLRAFLPCCVRAVLRLDSGELTADQSGILVTAQQPAPASMANANKNPNTAGMASVLRG